MNRPTKANNTMATKYYIKRTNIRTGEVQYKRYKCIYGWCGKKDDCWKFSKQGALNIINRYNKNNYLYELVEDERHTIEHLREAYAAYYTLESFINPATAKAKAYTQTRNAARLWGMDEDAIDWETITEKSK